VEPSAVSSPYIIRKKRGEQRNGEEWGSGRRVGVNNKGLADMWVPHVRRE
jgi:hypothetical protein